jgi:F-type H+-transporting ATPase subunit b
VIVLYFEILLESANALPEGRLFGLDSQTFISVAANFINVAILAFVLAKLLYKPVRDVLHNRAERIKDQFEQARDEMEKATEMKNLYEQKIKDIESERDEILDQARKLAVDTGRQIVNDAKKEAESVKERASATVELEWEQAQNSMRMAIIDVSAAMTKKFVTLAIDKETHDRLFDETMSELEGMTWKS